MREIAYFMLEPRAREAPSIRLGSRALRWETPRLERFLWRGYRVSLYLFPCRLEGTKRLRWWMERIGSALEERGTALWLTPELEAAWEDALRGRAGSLKVTVWAPAVAGCSAGGRNSARSAISGKFGTACGCRENGGTMEPWTRKRYQSRVSFLAGGLFTTGVSGFKRFVSGGAEGSSVGAFFRLAV